MKGPDLGLLLLAVSRHKMINGTKGTRRSRNHPQMRTIPQKGGLLSIYLVKNSDWHLFLIISWSLPCALYVSIVSSSSDISICCVSCIAILHHMLPAVSVVRNRYWKDGPDEMSSATSVAAPSVSVQLRRGRACEPWPVLCVLAYVVRHRIASRLHHIDGVYPGLGKG